MSFGGMIPPRGRVVPITIQVETITIGATPLLDNGVLTFSLYDVDDAKSRLALQQHQCVYLEAIWMGLNGFWNPLLKTCWSRY